MARRRGGARREGVREGGRDIIAYLYDTNMIGRVKAYQQLAFNVLYDRESLSFFNRVVGHFVTGNSFYRLLYTYLVSWYIRLHPYLVYITRLQGTRPYRVDSF